MREPSESQAGLCVGPDGVSGRRGSGVTGVSRRCFVRRPAYERRFRAAASAALAHADSSAACNCAEGAADVP
ncbi:MAG: hypothetical protein UZ03_NOB001000304 [Nitrospira sp. OLB3]|nr:MAG: hypothetical protein UZ03_NOB001000304 [Nitrospira sp. OLB3]